jgi:DNA-binding LytR/AlgR family response regulator
MKIIIIEDEQLSAEHLELLLLRIDPTIQLVQRFESVKQSVEAFQNGVEADLLFVDIHLADGNSFDIFKKVNMDIPVIFTTAFDQYAIQAFKTNSIDYLLKPIGVSDLQVSLQKFQKISQNQNLIQNLINIAQPKPFKNRFMVKLGENIISVKTEEIDHFKAEDGIVLFANKQGKRYPVNYTLDQLEPILDPAIFFRINRKVIINIDSIQKVGSFFNNRLKVNAAFIDGDDTVVSRERVGNFKDWLNR